MAEIGAALRRDVQRATAAGDFGFAGAAGGALSGATAGAALGPIGAVVGGLAGLVLGGLGGGGAEAPSPFSIAKRAATTMGLIPPGPTGEFYLKCLFRRGDQQAMQLALQSGMSPSLIRKWQTTDPSTWGGWRPNPPVCAPATLTSATVAPPLPSCQCDTRAEQILVQLVNALGGGRF